MDAITDPTVTRVSVRKSARIGWTKILDATIGFYMEHDPCPILAVQPTVEDAEGFSKEEIDPMLRDCPSLRSIVRTSGKRDGKNTILHKKYAGGVLSMVGANSGRGFRRVSRKIIALDEVDAYPASAGDDGDPINLAIKRSDYYWDRKLLIGSTPLVAGASRIQEEFEAGDKRRYYVPCPTCGHMDFLTFREQAGEDARGHWMMFDPSSPETAKESAHFICRGCGCEIEHKSKRWMVERGEWRADAPFRGHASFAIWSAYSYSPNSTWGDIAAEFVAANKGGPEKLKTFVNTGLGECWVEKGEAPEWRRLYDRREQYQRGTVPCTPLFLTAGVDVQKDRLEWEVVAWGDDRQSWSVDEGIIPGDPAKDETWDEADRLLDSTWSGVDGARYPIRMLGVDSGYETQSVYNWARRHVGRVIACKGSSTCPTLVGSPTAVDVTFRGKRVTRGCKVWPVGVDHAKAEFYGWLRLEAPTAEAATLGAFHPPGFCHFPEYGEEYFRQVTAEHRVKVQKRGGFVELVWAIIPGRQNHGLDRRIYARAATGPLRLDAIAAGKRIRAATSAAAPPAPVRQETPGESSPAAATPPPFIGKSPASGWLGGRRGSWLRR